MTHAPACKNAKPAEPQGGYLSDRLREAHQDDPDSVEPHGEPPIDWVGAKLSAEHGVHIPLNHLNNLCRAYLHLAAEVERLRGRVAELESGQPANYHGWCECYSCRKERAFKEVSHNDR